MSRKNIDMEDGCAMVVLYALFSLLSSVAVGLLLGPFAGFVFAAAMTLVLLVVEVASVANDGKE